MRCLCVCIFHFWLAKHSWRGESTWIALLLLRLSGADNSYWLAKGHGDSCETIINKIIIAPVPNSSPVLLHICSCLPLYSHGCVYVEVNYSRYYFMEWFARNFQLNNHQKWSSFIYFTTSAMKDECERCKIYDPTSLK